MRSIGNLRALTVPLAALVVFLASPCSGQSTWVGDFPLHSHPAGPEPDGVAEPAMEYKAVPSDAGSMISTPPVVPQPEVAAQVELEPVRKLVREGQFQQALDPANAYVAQKPDEPEGYFWQGLAFDGLGDSHAALVAYTKGIEQAIKLGQDSAELRVNAGEALMQQGMVDAALVQFRRAQEVDPLLPIVQLNIGRALIEKGDVNGALACFARCRQSHFEPPQLAYYSAKALWKAGRVDDARAQLNEALEKLSGQDELTKKIKQEFAELLQNGSARVIPIR